MTKTKTYTVSIYPAPYVIEVEAVDKTDAEMMAMYSYNHNNYEDIYKITVK